MGQLNNFDLKHTIKSEIFPNWNHMQHKLLKTNTYYSFNYNLMFLLVFTTFVDKLCLYDNISLMDKNKNSTGLDILIPLFIMKI